jgi:signal transduction histidine kinase
MAVALILSFISDFLLHVSTSVIFCEFLYLAAVVVAGLAWQRFDKLWTLSFIMAWASVFLAFCIMGGAQSPFFAAQLILLFFTGACTFRETRPIRLFVFLVANGVAWVAVTLYVGKNAVALPPLFVIKHNAVLMFCGMAVLTDFLTRWQNQKFHSELQAQRLLELEGLLIHSDKMAEIGKLVASTAHELAQPAQVILTSSSLIKRFVASDEVDKEVVIQLSDRLLEASERLARLLVNLKNFSRKESCVSRTKIDAREPISSVSVLLDYDLRSRGVRFDMSMPPEPIWISGDAHRLQQVILNLANNARDEALRAEKPWVSIKCEKNAGWVRVFVTNNGPGIGLDVQARLFEPYFTTKSRGEGTGLGLSICKQLIEEHSGRILFSSSNEKTVFVIDIPLLQEEAKAQPAARERRFLAVRTPARRSS